MKETKPEMRSFETGATRNTDDGKLDYEGFLSPFVLRRYAEYLNQHRRQADGKMRASDNWQKGIPLDVYMKSKCRHFVDGWMLHRGGTVIEDGEYVSMQEALCADLFNTMGYLHELMKAEETEEKEEGPEKDKEPYSVHSPQPPEELPCKGRALVPRHGTGDEVMRDIWGKCGGCSPGCRSHPEHATKPGLTIVRQPNPMFGRHCLRIDGKCEHEHYKGCLSCESTPAEDTP